jgi:hypothetical protein
MGCEQYPGGSSRVKARTWSECPAHRKPHPPCRIAALELKARPCFGFHDLWRIPSRLRLLFPLGDRLTAGRKILALAI